MLTSLEDISRCKIIKFWFVINAKITKRITTLSIVVEMRI